MGKALGLRDDYDALPLRLLARKTKDVRVARRLLALACVYDGMDRSAAAKAGGMDRQSLRDWVIAFNAKGPDGLCDGKGSGSPAKPSLSRSCLRGQTPSLTTWGAGAASTCK